MAYFSWDDIIVTNIEEIDKQHKKLLDLTNELYDAIKDGNGKDVSKKMLVEISNYIKFHFEAEEKIISERHPEEYEHHKQQHKMLIEKIAKILKQYSPDNQEIPNQIFDVLRYWVIQHIKKSDIRYLN